MASYKYHYRGSKENGNISIRLIHKELDCTLSTPYVTKRNYWIQKTTKNGKPSTKHKKVEELKGDDNLKIHQAELIRFREKLEIQLEKDLNNGVPITKEWLKQAILQNSKALTSTEKIKEEQDRINEAKARQESINEKNKLLNIINFIYPKYSNELGKNELKKFKTTHNWITQYQNYKLEKKEIATDLKAIDFTQSFANDFKNWAVSENKYKTSSAVGHLKRIKRAIKYAESNEDEGVIITHRFINDITFITKRESQKKNDKIIVRLSFDEFDKIDNLDLTNNKALREVQKCMLIGSETGLRFTDFGKLNDDNLKTTIDGVSYWEFKTSKTKKWVQITKTDRLKYFLYKYGNPKTNYSDNEDIVINRGMKEICRMAGINEETEMEISTSVQIDNKTGKQERRYVKGIYPKYKGITTRTLRRSFATNYYGLMDTELITNVTGHQDVRSLREYIDVHDDSNISISFHKINEIHRNRATGLRKVN